MDQPRPVLELRVALTTAEHKCLNAFYTQGYGLELAAAMDGRCGSRGRCSRSSPRRTRR